MAIFKIRYLTKRAKGARNGGGFRYFWQPSKRLIAQGWCITRLSDDETEAMRQAEVKNRELDAWYEGQIAQPTTEAAGTMNALINHYFNSREFAEKKPKTKKTYQYHIKYIREWAGDLPARSITPGSVRKLYEALEHKRAVANNVIRALRMLMEYGRRNDLVSENPALRPGIRDLSKKGKLWSHEAVAHFVAVADRMGHHSIGTAVLLNEWMGQRKEDVLLLKRDQYREGSLAIIQEKTGAEVLVPIHMVPHLHQRLEEELARATVRAPSAAEILIGPEGRRWNEHYFTKTLLEIRREAAKEMPELKELTFMYLRHTAITRMGEAGLQPAQIAAISGHSQAQCVTILNRYNVTTSKLAREAFRLRFESEMNDEKSNVRVFSESNGKADKEAACNR